jgi:NAD(P)-dependent dehydrogenase (short-subunit alcohol dehydrogenase family)
MKTALIIGASRGIGHEFVRKLLADGCEVYATARGVASLDALKAEGTLPLKLDVAKSESVAGLAWQLDGEKIDFAAYVAGVFGSDAGAFEAPTNEHFDAVMNANVRGAMQVLPLVAPFVEAAKGKFAFITGCMGSVSDAQSSMGWVYRTSRAALNVAVHSARHDYLQLTLVTMNPGWAQTDMGDPGAPTSVQDSWAGMRRVIDQLTPADSGTFQSYDGRKMMC